MANLTEEELAAYGKHKTNSMYTKYSNYRMLAFLIFGISGILGSIYYHKNRLKSVTGTLLVHQAERYFLENQKIKNLLVTKNKKQVKWDKNVSGGIRKEQFECQIRVQGIPQAKVKFEGIRQEKKLTNHYKKFIFEYKDKDEIKKIDLLV